MVDYRRLAQNVQNRLNPDGESLVERKLFADLSDAPSDILKYIKLAMRGVEPAYTQKSVEAGQRVKEHLSSLSDVVFEYQGSVMTNTHIKGASDIDLLTICSKFYGWDSVGVNSVLSSHVERNKLPSSQISKLEYETRLSPYTGNCLEDLRNIRLESEKILRDIYSQFDASNGKAIKISNLHLNRDVDIVTASWYDNVSSIVNGKGDYRGLQVYDKSRNERCPVDYPFLSIKRINERGNETNDRLKKMIRFLKNIKEDANQNVDLSSFDINAVCYDIDVVKYVNQSYSELVYTVYCQLDSICKNKNHSDNVVSVDGKESIFRNDPTKLENLKRLLSDVATIFVDVYKTK
jgi:hypothetical protein